MHVNLATAIGGADEFRRRSGYFDTVSRVERVGAERCARSSLARKTVTERRQLRPFAKGQSESATGALGIGHGNSFRLRGEIKLNCEG